jgi:aspartate-semialdehyde dehydrogenase
VFETERPVSVDEIRKALSAAPESRLVDDPQNYVYPNAARECRQGRCVCGSRAQKTLPTTTATRCGSPRDQIRKGAALNAVQIGEYLIQVGNVK